MFASLPPIMAKARVAIVAGCLALAGVLGGYAIHEHHAAQEAAAQNAQTTAALEATRHQVGDLTDKVNMLVARAEAPPAPPAPPAPSTRAATAGKPSAARRQREDPRFNKLQTQLDAQGKEIDQTRTDLAGTQGDLVSTRTELSGSIAHTHDELVLLEKKGERNYVEFDITGSTGFIFKSKDFHRTGPFSISLRKADSKHQFADLDLLVGDRNLTQKHVNLYQPVMYSTPGSPQPVEIVINDIGKNHIHGYVSAPKYTQSDLAAMSTPPANPAGNASGIADSGPVQVPDTTGSADQSRQKLPKPSPEQQP